MENSTKFGALAIAVLLLQACDEPAPAPSERVRAIKHLTVSEPAGGISRTYSGTISAAQSSSLSFAVSGTVAQVDVAEGARVAAGQVLAVLDQESFELDLRSARSQLASAQAAYTEARLDQDRKQELFRKGWVAKAAIDAAMTVTETARGSVEIARSQVGQAERNLNKTQLTAPFDGVIASRNIEAFSEVAAGSPVFELNAAAGLEVAFAVPDGVVERIAVGQTVEVSVSNVDGCGCQGRIIEIGSAAGVANTVSVTAAIGASPDTLLPGMAAEARLTLSGTAAEDAGFLIPLVAVAPGARDGAGYIFRYDPAEGVVRRVAIKGGEGRDNLIAVREGLRPGDIIAIAGVSFLRDGQKVTLLEN